MALLAGYCAACAILIFGLAWVAARKVGNAAWVDVAWALAFLPVAAICAAAGSGDVGRRLALLLCVGLWSLRLGIHLARRVAADRTEDPRYQELRRLFGRRPWTGFFWFFQAQGLLVILLAIPFYSAASDTSCFPGFFDYLGWAAVFGGLVGETIADAQLQAFRSSPGNSGRVCEKGLWGWSRHPNYFFEWVIWVGFASLGTGGPAGAWSWLAPALMFLLLTKVTGIPPAEARSLASRGEAYRSYQRRVSAFFPWPPRRESESRVPDQKSRDL